MSNEASGMITLLEEKQGESLTIYLKGPRKFVGFKVIKVTGSLVILQGEKNQAGISRILCTTPENIEAFTYDDHPTPQKEQEGPDDPESDTDPQEEEEISPDDAEEEGVSDTPPKDDGEKKENEGAKPPIDYQNEG